MNARLIIQERYVLVSYNRVCGVGRKGIENDRHQQKQGVNGLVLSEIEELSAMRSKRLSQVKRRNALQLLRFTRT